MAKYGPYLEVIGPAARVIAQVHSLKLKVQAVHPLVQSATSADQLHLHHTFLRNAIDEAKSVGVQLAPDADNMHSVRLVTALAESMEWAELARVLSVGLEGKEESTVAEIRSRGILHATESIMRSPVVVGDSTVQKQNMVGLEKLSRLQSLLEEISKSDDLQKGQSLEALRSELGHLGTFVKETIEQGTDLTRDVKEVECARTILTAKNSVLKLVDQLTSLTPEELLQKDGKVTLPDQSKWADLASKTNIVTASASAPFQEKCADKIAKINGKQKSLAHGLLRSLIQAIAISHPKALAAMDSVLRCYSNWSAKVDWSSHVLALQAVVDANLRLLLSFDVKGVWGGEAGASFEKEIERMMNLFQVCLTAGHWMLLGWGFKT
ncbi:unnamed protein product [Durusdinium trenchii]|uniref:Uncharacterized protein n=1 Tax=Durusdinium trenchii TaxID=1381693 RepID=A0ABP0L052_9DINO